jgi:SAM-dependent methyltransferase
VSPAASQRCPACADLALRYWFDKAAESVAYPVWRCRSCCGAFVLPRPGHALLEAFYGEHYRREAAASAEEGWRKVLDEEAAYPNSILDAARMVGWCSDLTRGRRFLDIGAGFGFFSREAVAAGFSVTALEPAPFCRESFFYLNGFQSEPRMLDLAFALEHRGEFDVALMSQVLEHLPDLEETLKELSTLLVFGGIAAMAVPHFRSLVSRLQGRRDMFIAPPEHLNFFTAASLIRLFGRHGFSFIRVETVSRFDPRRLAARLGWAGAVATPFLRAALRAADATRTGMYLNAYFRKG